MINAFADIREGGTYGGRVGDGMMGEGEGVWGYGCREGGGGREGERGREGEL